MIRSMTGFGRCETVINGREITVEIKSVNHRYFEFSCRTPRSYGFLDDKLKNYVNSRVSRGKIDMFVSIGASDEEPCDVTVNAFVAMRETEGEKMKEDILSRANTILSVVGEIEERSPQTVAEYEQRLMERIKQTLAENDVKVDEQRILTEVAVFADKVAVAEETVRLRSHFDQLSKFLEYDEPVGRKIDFIIQEMNRESNTIGSKVQDAILAHKVVDIKSEIEKIREQVQNIE